MIEIHEKQGGHPRCAVCHDEKGELTGCEACGTRFHADCRGPRCPTLGCQAGAAASPSSVHTVDPPVARVRHPGRSRLGRVRENLGLAAAALLASVPTLTLILLAFLRLPLVNGRIWRFLEREGAPVRSQRTDVFLAAVAFHFLVFPLAFALLRYRRAPRYASELVIAGPVLQGLFGFGGVVLATFLDLIARQLVGLPFPVLLVLFLVVEPVLAAFAMRKLTDAD